MSINGPSEITAKASRGRADGGFLGRLHEVALTSVVAGALGSVGLMLWVGHRNPSRLLLGLFVIWVLSPFMALLLANMVSKRWSVITRATLYGVMLILTLSSLAFYGDVVWRPRPQPAFMFLVVPFGSWLLMTVVVSIAALISGKLSRPGARPLK
jgi:multisubunit Na+/H+ antiporter MnhG subunit